MPFAAVNPLVMLASGTMEGTSTLPQKWKPLIGPPEALTSTAYLVLAPSTCLANPSSFFTIGLFLNLWYAVFTADATFFTVPMTARPNLVEQHCPPHLAPQRTWQPLNGQILGLLHLQGGHGGGLRRRPEPSR